MLKVGKVLDGNVLEVFGRHTLFRASPMCDPQSFKVAATQKRVDCGRQHFAALVIERSQRGAIIVDQSQNDSIESLLDDRAFLGKQDGLSRKVMKCVAHPRARMSRC